MQLNRIKNGIFGGQSPLFHSKRHDETTLMSALYTNMNILLLGVEILARCTGDYNKSDYEAWVPLFIEAEIPLLSQLTH